METEYQSTFDSEGNSQPKLHTKRYLHLTEDIHYSKGICVKIATHLTICTAMDLCWGKFGCCGD